MIVTVEDLKTQLNQTLDVDDGLIESKIKAAQQHIERLLGCKIEDNFGGDEQDEIPEALKEAVLQLASHWYENREAVLVGVSGQELPLSVSDIVREFRGYSYG